MMTNQCYMLWYYDGYGPEGLVATLDATKLPAMAQAMDTDDWFGRSGVDVTGSLHALLSAPLKPGIYKLMDGWGGLHLQVVELQ